MCANATGMRMRDNPKWIPTELDLFDGSSGELGRKSECFVLNYYHPKVIHHICHFFSTWHTFGFNFSPHKKRVNRDKTDFTVKQRKPLID